MRACGEANAGGARFCARLRCHAAGARPGRPRGPEDRHDPLLRRRRLDVARRGDRPRDDASGHVALRGVDGGDRPPARRDGRAVPRRRGDGRVRRARGHEDDALRAVRTGMEMQRHLAELNAELRANVGRRARLPDRHQHGRGRRGRPRDGRGVRDRRRGQPRQATGAGRRAGDDPDRDGDVPAREGRRQGRAARAVHRQGEERGRLPFPARRGGRAAAGYARRLDAPLIGRTTSSTRSGRCHRRVRRAGPLRIVGVTRPGRDRQVPARARAASGGSRTTRRR